MNQAKTLIKLYSPGISFALEELNNLRRIEKYKDRILRSGIYIGETADYEIVWDNPLSAEDSLELVKYLDDLFSGFKCRYTVTTSNPKMDDVLKQLEASKKEDIALTFIRLIGPSISQAIALLNANITELAGMKDIIGELIGKFDYAFQWRHIPEVNDIIRLSKTLDTLLKETGVIYTITTKSKLRILKSHKAERTVNTDLTQFVISRII